MRHNNPAAPPPPPSKHRNTRLLDKHVGAMLRTIRKQHHLTLAEVSKRAGISRSMLSKIENALASASLDTLEKVADALGVTMTRLFRNYKVTDSGAQFVKKGYGLEVVRRGTRSGHTYHLLSYDQGPQKTFEPFLINLEDKSEQFPEFEHPGSEFIYMLEGELEYRVAEETFFLTPGDALSFHSAVPHGPGRLIAVPIKFISIIHHREELPSSLRKKPGS